jgi:hypothetical protein
MAHHPGRRQDRTRLSITPALTPPPAPFGGTMSDDLPPNTHLTLQYCTNAVVTPRRIRFLITISVYATVPASHRVSQRDPMILPAEPHPHAYTPHSYPYQNLLYRSLSLSIAPPLSLSWAATPQLQPLLPPDRMFPVPVPGFEFGFGIGHGSDSGSGPVASSRRKEEGPHGSC